MTGYGNRPRTVVWHAPRLVPVEAAAWHNYRRLLAQRHDREEVVVALGDFWLNVRRAARKVAPDVIAEGPKLDSAAIQQKLRDAVLWLTPKSVEGFDPSDFEFLSPAERKALTEAVKRFRQIAERVPPDKPATDEQIQQALPQFQRIVEILRLTDLPIPTRSS